MKKALARIIIKHRVLILILVLLTAVWSALQIGRTRINYDLTKYLSDDTMTKKALVVMKDNFGSAEQLRIAFEEVDDETLKDYIRQLNDMDEIQAVQYNPANNLTDRNGKTRQLVTLTLENCNAPALVTTLREMFPAGGSYWVGGSAAQQLDVQKSVGAEIPAVMVIAVGVVILVLLLTSHAWLEPVVLIIVFSVSILINMGTNFLFTDVSFITFAVCAILQLALSIDYAIMLLHTWDQCLDDGKSPEEAMEEALVQCFMRIASSAMTTVAGLLSLLFMSFTIGFDIGMVLSKGILISMLCVFTLMPAFTLLLSNPLRKTRHRPIRLGGEKLGGLIWRRRKMIAPVLILLVAGGAFLSFRNTYSFSETASMNKGETGRITELFGASNPLVLLTPGGEEDKTYDRERELVRRLQSLKRADGTPVLKDITAMVTTGEAALAYYTPADVAEMTGLSETAVALFFSLNNFGDSVRADRLLDAAQLLAGSNESVGEMVSQLASARKAFTGGDFHRMLLEPAFSVSDPDFHACMDAVLAEIGKSYTNGWYITGGPMSTYDISNAFRGDLTKVNLITFLAILLIVVISFRSLPLPVLLVLVIEGAIWITMGISRIINQPIFFVSYLICLSIQMGATIDYGILICDQYRMIRRTGSPIQDALKLTLKRGLPTVLTSGMILITAGYIIGRQCSIYYIYSIGLLVSRGALMSVLLVLTLLPALLSLFDRWILGKRKVSE